VTGRVRFHPDARAEFDADADWYDARRPDLGDEFIDAVEAAVEDCAAHPARWPLFPGVPAELGVRRRVVQRFPYLVAYLAYDDGIVVVAVAHASRRPGYWRARTG